MGLYAASVMTLLICLIEFNRFDVLISYQLEPAV